MLDSARRLMAPSPSSRSAVPPFMVMDVVAAAARLEAAGRRIIHMEIGQPAAGAPMAAIAAAQAALVGSGGRREGLGYTESLGIPSLRQRIARHYAQRYGADIGEERIVVTTGSSAGFLLAFLALFETGDRVAMANPAYPPYRNLLAALGCEPVALPLSPANRFALAPDVLLAEHRRRPLKGVLIANPANPTGTMMSESALAALIGAAEDAGIACICDEIYHGLDYEFAPQTAAKLSANAVVINSFSKYYCMTGWRLGWMVVPPDLARSVECLAQNFYISPPALSQLAAVPVFDCEVELGAHVARYRVNRDLLIAALQRAGLSRFAPAEGAFYLYVDVSALTDDSDELCRRLLAETGVAMTPGLDFHPIHGSGWIRLSFAGPTEDIAEAARRLGDWVLSGKALPQHQLRHTLAPP